MKPYHQKEYVELLEQRLAEKDAENRKLTRMLERAELRCRLIFRMNKSQTAAVQS